MNILFFILQISFIPLASPLCVGIIRKLKAKLQNRQGASIFQPYQDLRKLFRKDEVISKDASFIFRIAPFIVFAVTLAVGASVPLFASFANTAWSGDFLLVIYALAIGTFFLALAGLDVGGGFGGFGSSREMTVSALAEGGFIFSLLTLALASGGTNLFHIAGTALLSQSQLFLPVSLAFIGFVVILLAETARYPFDNPATHLELTMIHEAMILEYSGTRLALMEWAAANKLLIFIALGANLFFPWGIAHAASFPALLISALCFFAKIGLFCAAIAILESSMAKFRFFRLPDLLVISFILNVIAVGIIYSL